MSLKITYTIIMLGILITLIAGCAQKTVAPLAESPDTQQAEMPTASEIPGTPPQESPEAPLAEGAERTHCVMTPDLIRQYCRIEGVLKSADYYCGVNKDKIPFVLLNMQPIRQFSGYREGHEIPISQTLDDVVEAQLYTVNTIAQKYPGGKTCGALGTQKVSGLGDEAVLIATSGCDDEMEENIEKSFTLFIRKGTYLAQFVSYLGDEQRDWDGKIKNGCSNQEAQDFARAVILPELERLEGATVPVIAPKPRVRRLPKPAVQYPLNCGEDNVCFSYHLANCTPGATADSGASGFAMYRATLQGRRGDKCAVRNEYTENINPKFLGPTMECLLPQTVMNAEDYELFTQSDNFQSCSGLLKEAFTDPAAFLGQ